MSNSQQRSDAQAEATRQELGQWSEGPISGLCRFYVIFQPYLFAPTNQLRPFSRADYAYDPAHGYRLTVR